MKESRDADGSNTPGSQSHESTARRPKIEPRRGAPTSFELIVLEGPDEGARITLDPSSASSFLIVGNSPVCGLRLADDAVSPRHCSLQVAGNQLRLVDLASSTTRVNGVLTREALLLGGEIVRLGNTVIAIHRTEVRSGVVRRVVSFGRIHGESDAMRALYPVFAGAVQDRRPVLVEGERGVGKRLLAEEIHRQGMPPDAPFVAFSERGVAAEDIARSLFERGGLVERARGGTLFIEEVRGLDEAGQHKLLALLDARNERDPRQVRHIVATRGRTAGPLVDRLLFRFPGTRITLPPLRAREGDVTALARFFWSDLGGSGTLPDDFAARFEGHMWPGNVRELRIAVHDRMLHGNHQTLESEPARLRPSGGGDPLSKVIESDLPFVRARHAVLAEFEKLYVARALERSGKSVARAAEASGVAHRYFQLLRSRRRPA
jgi:two-component system, NtrC family, response regulator HydG